MSKPENPVAVRREATGVPLGSTQARPFVKWAGGKRTLVPEIARLLPATFNEYWEPFVGGGAVFFALGSRFPRAHLSDTNRDLVIAYQVIQDNPEPLIGRLEHHAEMHSPDHYSAVREQHDQEDRVAIAARFIYLNKTAYNGLFYTGSLCCELECLCYEPIRARVDLLRVGRPAGAGADAVSPPRSVGGSPGA